jgi:multicomponent Na+:H+ antiporter subunit E
MKVIRRAQKLAWFVLFFLWELLLANLRVARDVLLPLRCLRPGIIAVPLDVTSDVEIALLSNLITLTPGTLSLDVSADRRFLYVHVMNLADAEAARRNIKEGLERKALEAIR